MGITITGTVAELQIAGVWRLAARLSNWTLDGTTRTITATVHDPDDYRLSQQPMMFVVPKETGQPLRRPVLADTLQIADGTLTAVLAPQE